MPKEERTNLKEFLVATAGTSWATKQMMIVLDLNSHNKTNIKESTLI